MIAPERPGAPLRLIVGITGASGAIYAVRLLKACLELGVSVDLVVSDYGHRLLMEECGLNLKTEPLPGWLDRTYGPSDRSGEIVRWSEHDLDAPIASGSQDRTGMAVVPCSMKTLSGIAHGSSSNLIERAADVTLKEGRPLVLVPRETPLNRIHLDNMVRAATAGATLVAAMPAFYFRPRGFEDLADFIAGRVLAALGLPHRLVPAWKEERA